MVLSSWSAGAGTLRRASTNAGDASLRIGADVVPCGSIGGFLFGDGMSMPGEQFNGDHRPAGPKSITVPDTSKTTAPMPAQTPFGVASDCSVARASPRASASPGMVSLVVLKLTLRPVRPRCSGWHSEQGDSRSRSQFGRARRAARIRRSCACQSGSVPSCSVTSTRSYRNAGSPNAGSNVRTSRAVGAVDSTPLSMPSSP